MKTIKPIEVGIHYDPTLPNGVGLLVNAPSHTQYSELMEYFISINNRYEVLGMQPRPHSLVKDRYAHSYLDGRTLLYKIALQCWYIPKAVITDLVAIPYSYTKAVWLVAPEFKIDTQEHLEQFVGMNAHTPLGSPTLFVTTMNDSKYDDYITCLNLSSEATREMGYLTKTPWHLLKSNTRQDMEKQLDNYITNNMI